MIDIHKAIYAINSSIVTIRGELAYDIDGNEVTYNKSAAEAKLTELQAAETTAELAKQSANDSATSKLKKLGLTDDEISALKGTL